MPKKPSAKKSVPATSRGTPKTDTTELENILADSGARGSPAHRDILTALADWAWAVPGRKKIPPTDIPDGARMLILMNELVSALSSSGLAYLADWDIGDDYRDIRRWAETIGAHTTVAYLDEFAALFPRKRVPADRDARSAALERRETQDAKKGLSPIATLDKQYRKAAVEEIAVRVRDYVRNNRLRFEAESSAAAAQPAGSSPDDLLLEEDDFITFNEGLLARYGADAAYVLPVEERTGVGDVIQVKVGRRFAYLQATHLHRYAGSRGPVMRGIEGIVPEALEGAALAAHVAGATAFVGMVEADQARSEKKAKLVARGLPVPAAHAKFPTFLFHWGKTRDGRNVWGEWKGGDHATGQHVGPLSPKLMSNPVVRYTPYPDSIGDAFRDGWTAAEEYESEGETPLRTA